MPPLIGGFGGLRRLPALLSLPPSDHAVDHAPDDREDREHRDEPADAEHDIHKFHASRPRQPLADLDGEGDHQNQREHIDPGDHHDMVRLRQKLEQRIDREDHQHAQQPDHQEVHLLVRNGSLEGIVQIDNFIVNQRDPVHRLI